MDNDTSKSVIAVVVILLIGAIAFVVVRYVLEKTVALLINIAVTAVVGVVVFSYCDSAAHRCDYLAASSSIARVVDYINVYANYTSVMFGTWWRFYTENKK